MISKLNNDFYVKIDGPDDQKVAPFDFSTFDHIYCIHYLPYKDRKADAEQQLKHIGISGLSNFSWHYSVPNKYYDLLFYGDTSKVDVPSVNITNVNYTVNSYQLVKMAYELGYERILVIEDDVRFLKDVSKINKILSYAPLDYDLILFEYFVWSQNGDNREAYDRILKNKINPFYSYFLTETVFDTGMLMLSRKMMKHIIDNDEKLLKPFDGYTRFQCCFDDSSLKRAISNVPLCIQHSYSVRQEETDCSDKYQLFRKEDYND